MIYVIVKMAYIMLYLGLSVMPAAGYMSLALRQNHR